MAKHTVDEIRSAVFDILSGREDVPYEPSQERHLEIGVAAVLLRRDGSSSQAKQKQSILISGGHPELDREDVDLFREVFYELQREGIIKPGLDGANRNLPFFSLTTKGRDIVAGQPPTFHDEQGYLNLIQQQLPAIDAVTLTYLGEAMRAYKATCILSATVMIGVATEHTFLLLLDVIDANGKHHARYSSVKKERGILKKFNKFRDILAKDLASLPADVKEDLDTQFAGILSTIRTFRNESGHPTGKIIDREQCYVLLNLFVPYAKKMYQLIDYFSQP